MISEAFQLVMTFFSPLPAAEAQPEPPAVQVEAPAAPAPNAAGLTCNLTVDRTSGRTRLVAEAVATRGAVHGSYELAVVKNQGTNRSRVRQGGDFDVAPGRPEVVGRVDLNGLKGPVHAQLTVDDGTDPVTCSTR